MSESADRELINWGLVLVTNSKAKGWPTPHLKDDADLREFVKWARNVSGKLKIVLKLPKLDSRAGYTDALVWALALDKAARGTGLELPALPPE